MLNYDLINKNCDQARHSIDQLTSTPSTDLWIIKDFVNQDILDKLQNYIGNVQPDQWSTVAGQENLPRHKITWENDSVIEELHIVCESVTQQLSVRFNRKLKFNGLQIWRDTPGYYFGKHTDHAKIDTSLQLYLFESDPCCGTTFFVNGTRFTIGFFNNIGYVCTSHQVPHETTTPVPPGVTRYSLYAHWCRAH